MPAQILRRWLPLLVYAAAVVVLLGSSLVGRTVTLPHDILQAREPWASTELGVTEPRNHELQDQIDQYFPLQQHLLERLRAGESATFVPDVMLGIPGAHFIGWGVVSPFTLLGLVLPFPLAWSLGMGLRLLAAMGGAHLLARTFGLRPAGATAAGLAYGLSGYMVLWLGWPQTHVGALLPWVLWAVRRCCASDPPWWGAPALALTAAGLWLGGFPAVSAYGLVAAGAVALHAAWEVRADRRRAGGGLMAAGVAVALGTALVAWTLLPSIAWLAEMDTSAREGLWRARVFPLALLTFIAPGVFGDVVTQPWFGSAARVETVGYAGVTTLLLALPAFVLRPRRPGLWLWGGLTAGALLIAYGFPPVQAVIGATPVLNSNAPSRVLVVVGLGLAVLGGYGVDALLRALGTEAAVHRAAAGGVGAVLAVTAGSAALLRPWQRVNDLAIERLPEGEAPMDAMRFAAEQMAIAGALVAAVGVLVLGVWLLRRRAVAAPALAIGLVALVGLDLLMFATGWNTRVPAGVVFPPAPGYDEVIADSEGHRSAGIDFVGLGNTSLAYGTRDIRARAFRTPRQREALRDVARFRYFSPTNFELDARRSAHWDPWLSILGVRSMLAPPGRDVLPLAVPWDPEEEILPPLTPGFSHAGVVDVARDGEVVAVEVVVAAAAPVAGRELVVDVLDDDGEATTASIPVAELRDGSANRITIEPVAVAAGDRVTIIASVEEDRPGDAAEDDAEVTTPGDPGAIDWPILAQGGDGALLVGVVLDDDPRWERTDLGDLDLFTNTDALPRVHLVTEVQIVDPADSLEVVGALTAAELRTLATVEPFDGEPLPDIAGGGPPGTVGSAVVDGARVSATVTSAEGGLVVVGVTPLPGWRATVDGQPAPLVVADHLLLGVPVEAGERRVELRYHPPLLREGAIISGLALLAWLGLGGAAWLRRRPPA